MRLRALLFCIIPAALFVSCSKISTESESLLGRVSSSASASEDQGTVHFEATVVSEIDLLEIEQAMTGAIDFANQRMQMTMEGDFFGEVETLLDSGIIYVRSDLFAIFGGTDAPEWFAMDVEDALEDAGLDASQPFLVPENTFEMLKTSGARVTEAGSETVRGVETTHFVITIDVELAADAGELEGLLSDGAIQLPEELTVEAWIDEDGLVRRIAYAFEIDLGPDIGEAAYDYTIEFFDYGKAVEFDLPDPDEVADFEDWIESTGASGATGGDWTDPFEGADCYGEKLESCFEPNPELAQLYGDPAECRTAERRVCMVPVGSVRRDVVEAILDFHRETAGIEIVVLPSVAIEPGFIDFEASQALTEPLFERVKATYNVSNDSTTSFIALTSVDLRPDDGSYGWWFGFRNGNDGEGFVHGMFTYFRMANVEPYDGRPLTDELLFERASKYMGRYVALLHLKWPMGLDDSYLNYHSMGGFSDLDSMGANWPEGSPPCKGEGPIVCVVPDGMYWDDLFEDDIRALLPDLEAATGIKVELYKHGGAYPTYDPWSEEYRNDLYHYMRLVIEDPDVVVVGVSDDPFAADWDLDRAIDPHLTRAWPDEGLAVASGFKAGEPGSDEHRERIFRLLLRAVRLAQGEAESDDPADLLYSGHTEPADLDTVTVGLS